MYKRIEEIMERNAEIEEILELCDETWDSDVIEALDYELDFLAMEWERIMREE